jgi:hypothetical protein
MTVLIRALALLLFVGGCTAPNDRALAPGAQGTDAAPAMATSADGASASNDGMSPLLDAPAAPVGGGHSTPPDAGSPPLNVAVPDAAPPPPPPDAARPPPPPDAAPPSYDAPPPRFDGQPPGPDAPVAADRPPDPPPMVVILPAARAPARLPPDTKVFCEDSSGNASDVCATLYWRGYMYWPLSWNDNRIELDVVAFDPNGVPVKEVAARGTRYIQAITVDPAAGLVTFQGQNEGPGSSQYVTLTWDDLRVY